MGIRTQKQNTLHSKHRLSITLQLEDKQSRKLSYIMIGGICHCLVILLLFKSSTCDRINEVFAAIKNDDTATLRRILSDNEATLGSFINLQDSESGQTPVMMSVLR